MLARLGRIDEAMARAEILASTTPDSGGVHYSLANLHYRLGDLRQALAVVERERFDFLRLELEAIVHHDLGEFDIAQQKLDELVGRYGDDVSWQVARVYAARGDADEMFAALERGYAVRDPGLVYIQSARAISPFHDDPRYNDLLKRMDLR
jgi:tetratricopeptide (TPR) repeat protein